jgi:hypothetical protein
VPQNLADDFDFIRARMQEIQHQENRAGHKGKAKAPIKIDMITLLPVTDCPYFIKPGRGCVNETCFWHGHLCPIGARCQIGEAQ